MPRHQGTDCVAVLEIWDDFITGFAKQKCHWYEQLYIRSCCEMINGCKCIGKGHL